MAGSISQVRRLESSSALRARLDELGVELPVDDPGTAADVLGEPLARHGESLSNRFCVLPMEGWDATDDGRPSDLVRRRWSRFGASGAALIWGGEAVAVDPAGRANPHQLCIGAHSERDLGELRTVVVDAHRDATDGGPEPTIGLQLTHSGRWSRPTGSPSPRTAYEHALLDPRVGATAASVLTDAELDDLVERFVAAAVVARDAGFDFVDVKHCHGYLLHELLSAVDRPGPYGGDLAGRTRFLRTVVDGIRRDAPELRIGVRLSIFDVVAHVAGPDGTGVPDTSAPTPYLFGGDGTGVGIDLTETHELCDLLVELGVHLLCVTAGSPYYCPHVQRPAYFPPSDGYRPPRDPLVDVARLQDATRQLRLEHPELIVVGSGLTYLQDHLPPVAAALVRDGWADLVGLGRMALSLPELPASVLAGEPLDRRHVCRTFSDCTTAPRHGLISGCFPLDEHYKQMPERVQLARIKRELRERSAP